MKFVGYDESSKGYRLVDSNNKIYISRDVRFLETKSLLNRNKTEQNINNELDVYFSDSYEGEEYFFNAENDEEEENLVDEENLLLNEPTRRSPRDNFGVLPDKYKSNNFLLYHVKHNNITTIMDEPKTFNQATHSISSDEWLQAMREVLNSIHENRTWELTDLPHDRKAIGSKWVFKRKTNENGETVRHKARLVAQGFSQKFGIDYDEVFAPVARSTTMRMLLSVAGVRGYKVRQYDVKTEFLNGILDEEIYLKQPQGFQEGNKVYKLKKGLYGLKQAARVWNQTLHESLIRNAFKQSETDKCLYIYCENDQLIFVLIHVDDILVTSNNEHLMQKLLFNVGKDFELKDLGNVKHYLGIDVQQDEKGNFMISQSNYIDKIVESARLNDAKLTKFPLDTGYYKLTGELLPSNEEYRKLIGMLLYLTTNSRPDIAASVSILSQKVTKPRDIDWNEVKRIIRYIKGTRDLKLYLSSEKCSENVFAFSDANWAEDREDRKSNSGYYCSINGGAISWSCTKQNVIAMSSTEAEYVALSETCKEVSWIKRIAQELKMDLIESFIYKILIVTIYCNTIIAISSITFIFLICYSLMNLGQSRVILERAQ